jgi:hypothetical protein
LVFMWSGLSLCDCCGTGNLLSLMGLKFCFVTAIGLEYSQLICQKQFHEKMPSGSSVIPSGQT